MNIKDWQPFILDLAVVIAVTVLTALRIMPAEACIAMLSAIAGARATQRATKKADGSSDPGASAGPSSSAVTMLLLGLVSMGAVVMRRGGPAVVLILALGAGTATTGCTLRDVRTALSALSQGAQYLGSLIEVADAGSSAWLARHPSQETQHQIDAALRRARTRTAALDGAIARGASDEEIATERAEALAAYAALRELLDATGVLSGRGAVGGAEAEAPEPGVVELPAVEVVAVAMGAGA